MITQTNLPFSYRPLAELVVCSNRLLGGASLLSIGDKRALPLLIGAGAQPTLPLVWLQVPPVKGGASWTLLLDASVPRLPTVRFFAKDDFLLVWVNNQQVLRLKATTEKSAVVDYLDLRPFGLRVFGTEARLTVGTSNFAGNIFTGTGSLIGFG